MQTILVVDDMPIFREPIEAVLCAAGFKVVTAANGREAVDALCASRPDLVLLDLVMPVMGGLAVLSHMRREKAFRSTPVIVLSADSDRSHIVAAARLGIAGYVLKSKFSLQAMMDLVRQTLRATGPRGGAGDELTPEPQSPPAHHTGGDVASQPAVAPQIRSPAESAANSVTSGAGRPGTTVIASNQPSGRGQPPEARVDPGADLKSLRPLMTRSELMERVTEEGELTGFSPTVSQVLKLTSSERCSMDQVAQAVSQDHTVALKVMRLANSSIYSRGDRVDTLHRAVLRIGMQSIRQAVLNIGVVEQFGSLAFKHHLSTPLFWEHSIACGIIAAELAHALGHAGPDTAFTAGLLHDLGRVLYAERLDAVYVQVLDAAYALERPLEQVESRLLLMNHAEVMNQILTAWKFPKDLISPIVLHHVDAGDVRAAAPHQVTESLRLGLADRLAHAMMLGSSGNDTIYPTEEHCRLLGVKPAAMAQIQGTVRQQTDDTKFALLSHSNSADWPRCVELHRAALLGPFRPLYVSASPELDAYRIFCDELAGASTDGPPNLAVVHIAAVKDRLNLSERLDREEQQAKLRGLPVLMLSPGGRLVPDGTAFAGRNCRALATPTPVSRFITAVNALIAAEAVHDAA